MYPELARCVILLVFHGTMLPFLAFPFFSLQLPSACSILFLVWSSLHFSDASRHITLKTLKKFWSPLSHHESEPFYHKMMHDTLLSCFFCFVFSFREKNWVGWSSINQTAILYKAPQQSILLHTHNIQHYTFPFTYRYK